jgi:hypothetical protein
MRDARRSIRSIIVVLIVIFFLISLFVLVGILAVEFDGIEADEPKVRAALVAFDGIAFIGVFIHMYVRPAIRAGASGHNSDLLRKV